MLYLSISFNIILFLLVIITLFKSSGKNLDQSVKSRLSQLDNIEREVRELNSIFTLPYLRGEAGETLLKELLNNYLPKGTFQLQYGFKNGSRVDAIIRTGQYIIPIDSKFPIQSVNEILLTDKPLSNQIIRTFMKHGEDIANKYISLKEGTLNFAVMYIPSEKLYYRAFIHSEGELISKLLKIGILPASPSSLFSLIQTVVYGLKGFTFNQRQNEIMEKIETLRTNYTKLNKQFNITNSHLKNLKASLNLCEKLIEEGEEIIPD
ncbi:DNA recombination protein RmuC [Thiospirochaeta perfilievii]|uniref:DNA recombination protein RmuC n=1 Tax=Thiospirochaeta perfilievii TaxID=252967 RepID=A0A5C1QED4_9SPIO|nr:DNA recombination protein RmuC [Thiospirochaeta perfilievii]QEN05006.1 DNA recombination protein RmuC [Thiospirochaeta perfilievii]